MPPGERQRFGSALPFKILLAGLALSAAAAFGWHRWVAMRTARQIALEAMDFEAKIRARFEGHLALLRGMRGLFSIAGELNREDFKRYTTQVGLAANYPGIQGIGFTRRILPGELVEVETEARRVWPDFRVWPEGSREEYHSIVLLEPEDSRNRAAIGYDMYTDPTRRAAMDRARDSGRAVLSGKVTLVQEIDADKQAGFLIYVPHFAGTGRPETVDERRARLLGFVYAPFRAADFIQGIVESSTGEVALAIYDDEPRPETLLFEHEPRPAAGKGRIQRMRTLQFQDRVWTIVYSAPGAGLVAPAAIFLGGLLVSAAAASLVGRERRALRRAEKEIEARRRAQRTARETEEKFHLLVAGARDYAIILIDAAGRIESWNEGAEHIFGFSEEEAVGLPLAKLSTAEDEAAGIVTDELARAAASPSVLDERWYVRKDGTLFWASGHTVALRDERQAIRGYAKILRDLTEQKRNEEDLERRVRERTAELNDAVQELEAFSYSVSHDLRSPLRSIRGFTELALEEAGPRLTEAERGYLDRVQRAVARLDRLISDLLAYTRVSKTKVALGPVDLHTLVSDIRREHPEFQPPQADVRIEGDLLPVTGHETYLTQALTNLLGNAVKFVKPGRTPEVRIWTERRHGAVRLFVRDNGIGIPRQHLHRAFEMFERLHTREGYEGTGVGLAIVRRAAQRMRGTVGVESEEGSGTTFWIELPAAEVGVGSRSEATAERG